MTKRQYHTVMDNYNDEDEMKFYLAAEYFGRAEIGIVCQTHAEKRHSFTRSICRLSEYREEIPLHFSTLSPREVVCDALFEPVYNLVAGRACGVVWYVV